MDTQYTSMMNQRSVIIFTSDKSKQGIESTARFEYVHNFCERVESSLDNVKVHFTLYDDVSVLVRGGTIEMYDHRNEITLKDVNFVHFKNWVNDAQTAAMLANYLKLAGVNFYNSEVEFFPARTKIAQMVTLAAAGVNVPDTYYASTAHLVQTFTSGTLPEGFNLPLILKANDGAMGNDNYLITSYEQAVEILTTGDRDTQYVLQAYHENDGDYRFLYIGLDEKPMVFHRKGTEGSHLNNTSQGGTGTLVDKDQVQAEYYEIAHKAASVLGREIGGVDILVDKHTNVPYVLEVNATPALATGYGVDEKIRRFTSFIERYIDVQEEE